MKQILGVVGEKRAGKDVFCDLFRNQVEIWSTIPFQRCSIHRYSDIIGECLNLMDIPKTRENMQRFSPLIESAYGKGIFSRAMTKRVAMSDSDVAVIQGIRWKSDLAQLRILGGTLLYVTADKKIRFERSRQSSEKADEARMTWATFEQQEYAQTEIDIPWIGARADFRIENNGTKEEFADAVANFSAQYLPSWYPK